MRSLFIPWKPAVLSALLAAGLSSFAPVALSIIDRPLSMSEMVAQSDRIVIGHSRAAKSVWVGRRLVTRYRIEIQETLLGPRAAELQVEVPGGVDLERRHPIAVVVPGAPLLKRDEQLALLLRRGGTANVDGGEAPFVIVGFHQGRIPLEAKAGEAPAMQLQQVRARLQALIATRGQAPAAPRFGVPGRGRGSGR